MMFASQPSTTAAPSSSSAHLSAAAAKLSALFPEDASMPYTIEVDVDRSTVDFYSKKKTLNKNFERVVSIKASENSLFHIKRVMNDGKDVDESWLCTTVEPLNTTARPSNKASSSINQEPGSPSSHFDSTENGDPQFSVVTPTESADAAIKKRKADTSTGNDLSILSGLTKQAMDAFITLYFSLPVSSIGEKEDIDIDMDSVVPILISIEGNIGAGKSYLLGQLRAAHPEWCFIDEPVEFWESLRNDSSESLLEVFYKDQRRWSYTFQNCALLSRYHNIETAITNVRKQEAVAAQGIKRAPMPKVFITERCLDTDHEVFAKMLHSDGQLDALEIDLYQRWFRLLQKNATQLSAIVYVDTQPTTCSERINIRNRDGEEGIPIEYLQSLDKFQRQWIDTTSVPIMRTPSDHIEHVNSFVAKLIRDSTPEV